MNELTKQQLAALVDVAKKNPEWALQQAFRFGVASAQSAPILESIKRAAEIPVVVGSSPIDHPKEYAVNQRVTRLGL